MTAADAARGIRDRFAVEPTVEGSLVTVTLPRDRWLEFARFAKADLGCRYYNWSTAVDWKEQGLEVVCRVENLQAGIAVTMRTRLEPSDPQVDSLVPVYRGADWMERECYDMLGVVFHGHPDLRRILLSQDWEGFPLRKDYAADTPHAPYR